IFDDEHLSASRAGSTGWLLGAVGHHLSLVERKLDSKPCALAWAITVGTHFAAMQLDHPLHQCQPQPEPSPTSVETAVCLCERFEEPLECFWVNAQPRVG